MTADNLQLRKSNFNSSFV